MSSGLHRRFGTLLCLGALMLFVEPAAAHRMEGELVVTVRDPAGLAIEARVELLSWTSQFRTEAVADADGTVRFKRLPFGAYRIRVEHSGFAPVLQTLEIRSELPFERSVELRIDTIETAITVSESAPLLDPNETAMVLHAGRASLDEAPYSTLGRGVINLIDEFPGWLLEANAVLHPRGSEYDTQYVIDGVPLYDNRSIAFVPAFAVDEFEVVNAMTGGIAAEFGRRLGGVIELHPRRLGASGHHSDFGAHGGSFGTVGGSFVHSYQSQAGSFSLGLRSGHTDRYLDPPSLGNFTNKATEAGLHARFERDFRRDHRLSLFVRSSRVGFLVPNDLQQQAAGQRQDRHSDETAAQVHYQHVFSPRAVGSMRGMYRDLSTELWSNTLSTPAFVQQDRGLQQRVLSGGLTLESGRHTLKFGGDLRLTDLRENFRFAERGRLPEADFQFLDRRRATDVGLFVQDRVRFGKLVVDAGLRFDHYRLLIRESAVSPRLGLGYYWPAADVLFRGSYDRVFQTPPFENLLLSSAGPMGFEGVEGALPVPGGRAHFYEAGVRKPLFGAIRVDLTHYWRDFDNFYDDDVFFSTGIGFPISFDSARVEGTEVRLELPSYRGLTSFVSYSNMLGTATSPVTGGLFLKGGEAAELRDIAATFPISQDQRNTVSSLLRYQVRPRLWVSTRVRYGSGLPVELESDGEEEAQGTGLDTGIGRGLGAIPSAILDKINFARGRVKPNFNLDFSFGAEIWKKERQSLTLQFDVVNATGRLNVINFTGLFSGTALAPGRMVGLKLGARM